MVRVIGVRFKTAGKVYYFDPGELELEIGANVIVETARGMEFGTVSMEATTVDEDNIVVPLKRIVRVACEEDYRQHQENVKKKEKAMALCQEKIDKHGLVMKLIDVEYTFDKSKIIFYFTADGRVDFRELVKDLASVFKMRIELRQIGVRDEAKMLGGIGSCRTQSLLPQLAGGLRAGVDQDGKGAESVSESGEDLRHLRQTDVLPEIRKRHLYGAAQRHAGYRRKGQNTGRSRQGRRDGPFGKQGQGASICR